MNNKICLLCWDGGLSTTFATRYSSIKSSKRDENSKRQEQAGSSHLWAPDLASVVYKL